MRTLKWDARSAVIAVGGLAVLSLGLRGAAAGPVSAPVFAAPWAIIFHGTMLRAPVTLADWHENHRFLLATPAPGTATAWAGLRERPYVEIALFWGPEWKHLAGSPDAVARLRPEQANQRAWFFPARGAAPAVIAYDPPVIGAFAPSLQVRVVEHDGLELLTQRGVPVRLDP